MPKTQVKCPNCRQPVVADVVQLFDVNQDPRAKQILLSGTYNLVSCPVCGYQGNLATPIVYHDSEKELLLTFVPAELGLPQNEQERLIGGLINQVLNNLPQEKRKGYLLRPQSTLTMQGLVERVLEADGITKEMLQAQQQRLSLLQRLASATDEAALTEIASQEDGLIDAEFFSLLSHLAEAANMGGDQESARRLAQLQRSLLPITTFGRQVQAQSEEYQAAIADLRAAGSELTREKMLELVTKSPNDTRLRAFVSLARPAMDYTFFQMLSERIDRSRGEGRTRLVEARAKLLEMTQEYDRQLEAHVQETREMIEALLMADDLRQAMVEDVSVVDQFFLMEVTQMLEQARKQGDLERSGKLQQILDIIEEASAQPHEIELIKDYLEAPDDQARRQFLEQNQEAITPEFMDMLANIALQAQSGDDPQFAKVVMEANRQVLRFSMERNLNIQ
ncbi:MAG: hypothetical protein JXA78_12520 [Anaerolineales bacterium]|nr:hypothetical protein [Anaerolineales bacterium]